MREPPNFNQLQPLQSSQSVGEPLILKGSRPFGVGGRRLCFVHPGNSQLCVKVARSDVDLTARGGQSIIPKQWRRVYDNNTHEQAVLNSLFARLGDVARQFVPQCYGMVKTDLGDGLVLDLIRDADGGISRSIRELVGRGMALESLRPAFEEFGQALLKYHVVTRKLLDHNIVVQQRADGHQQLFLIDGLGDPAWIPLTRWIHAVAEMRIKKNLHAAWLRFEALAASGGVSEALRQNSNWGQGFLDHRGMN